jgi:hypothetical protein
VVRGTPVAVEPASTPDTARRHAALHHLEDVQDAGVKRALHVDLPRGAARAADREVTRAVDRKTVVCGQRFGEHVGEQALGQAAGVELDAGRARHARCARVHVDLAPVRVPARSRGRSSRCERERELQRQRPAQVAHVAAVLDLLEQRAVDQSAGAHGREHDSLGKPRHQRARRYRPPRVGVEQRELAVGQKARELVVPLLQAKLRQIGGVGGALLRAVALHQHLARGAEAVKRSLCLHARAHDCEVVTDDGLLLLELDSELFSFELDSELDPELPSLEPLEEDEEPVDVSDPDDLSCAEEPEPEPEEEPEPEDCELVDAAFLPAVAALDALLLVRSDELGLAAALRLAAAASAGSWPETSWT